ncbi:hypothetical protein Tco_0099205 [Tanacetum coccineum]
MTRIVKLIENALDVVTRTLYWRSPITSRKDKNQRAFVGVSWSNSGEEDDEKVKDKTCIVAHASSEMCLGVDLEPDEWIQDSGCSKHMTRNRKLFSTYRAYNEVNVFFEVFFAVTSLAKCRVTFSEHDSEITKDGKVIVRDLPKLKFDQHFCDACKMGKQAHASHKAKNIVSTTRCLELLHMDLFGPSAVRSYGGNRYTLVIVDDYSSKEWNSGDDQLKLRWMIYLVVLEDAAESVDAIIFEYCLSSSDRWANVHDTFHVSNLEKCLADANLHVPLDEIKVDKTLRFVEEHVEIMDREI